jgi:hypothetical protein
MKITVRGWGRDMGEKQIANHFLLTTEYKADGTVYRDTPILYKGAGNIIVAWFQRLKLTGHYRMEVQLSPTDVMTLFKCLFGSELDVKLIERYGLTFSPEATKAILRTVKLSDLTLGDLAAMGAASPEEPATADKLVESENVTALRRRA